MRNITSESLALVLAGEWGSHLNKLTQWRAKPAVPFGGKYRIIDFPLSNCLNSGVRRIGILTQYKAHSLIGHIQKGWGFLSRDLGEFIELLPAQKQVDSSWYSSTANAVYQNLDIIQTYNPEYVLILSGDHIYKMDYGSVLAQHAESNSDITVCCIELSASQAGYSDRLQVDNQYRVQRFEANPTRLASSANASGGVFVSMGVYVFKTEYLVAQLIRDADCKASSHSFGQDIIPYSVKHEHKVGAYYFFDAVNKKQAYWRDLGTVDSYWRANLELIDVTPELNLYDEYWPIWTYQEQAPPAKFIFNGENRRGMAVDSMISGGCIISGAYIRCCLLFSNVIVNDHSSLDSAVVLPDVRIGKYCRIKKAVIDRGVVIPDGMVIGEDVTEDAKRFYLSPEGVVLVVRGMLTS